MPKLICVNCQTELHIEKTGSYVIEMFLDPPVPYKIWQADVWKCPGCRSEIVAGFAHEPFVEHFEEGFKEVYKKILADKTNRITFAYEKPFAIQADNKINQELDLQNYLKGGDL